MQSQCKSRFFNSIICKTNKYKDLVIILFSLYFLVLSCEHKKLILCAGTYW